MNKSMTIAEIAAAILNGAIVTVYRTNGDPGQPVKITITTDAPGDDLETTAVNVAPIGDFDRAVHMIRALCRNLFDPLSPINTRINSVISFDRYAAAPIFGDELTVIANGGLFPVWLTRYIAEKETKTPAGDPDASSTAILYSPPKRRGGLFNPTYKTAPPGEDDYTWEPYDESESDEDTIGGGDSAYPGPVA